MPVDIGSGAVHLEIEDAAIPGRLPLVWERRYHSAFFTDASGPFGPGWSTPFSASLTRNGTCYEFRTPAGGTVRFDDPDDKVARDGILRDLGSNHEISRNGLWLRVTHWEAKGRLTRFNFQPDRNGQWWPLRLLEDAHGTALELAWDDKGRLKGVRQRLERRTLAVQTSAEGRILSVSLRRTDGSQATIATYGYDKSGRLAEAADALGNAVRYEYSSEGRLARELAKDGAVFSYKYDDTGRCIRFQGLDGYNLKALRYVDVSGLVEVTDSLGNIRRYERLPTGQLSREIDAMGGMTLNEYDGFGRIILVTDPLGGKTAFAYDEAGNRISVVDALGNETKYGFGPDHQIVCETDPSGGKWERTLDASNRVIAATDPSGALYSMEYDGSGNPVKLINPDGSFSSRKYSETGELIELTDCKGAAGQVTWDEYGRLVRTRDPDGLETRTRRDALGRIVEAGDNHGRRIRYEYDTSGNLIRWQSSLAPETRMRYGTCGRLIERTEAGGQTTRFHWGKEPDRLEKVVNGDGETHRIEYDACGRVVKETGFGGASYAYRYDTSGRQIRKVNILGEAIVWERDLLGRVVSETIGESGPSTFRYDPLGNLSGAANGYGEIRFERDALGRIVKEDQNGCAITRAYDVMGNRVGLKSPLGADFGYAYDPNGLLAAMNAAGYGEYRVTRDASNHPIGTSLPGGLDLLRGFDPRGRLALESIGPAGSPNQPLVRREYAYDDSDRMVSMLDTAWGATRYRHDERGGISETRTDSGRKAYRTAANGNTVAILEGEVEEALTYGPGGGIIAKGASAYRYDPAGRLTEKTSRSADGSTRIWVYAWDARDRLIGLTNPAGESWAYSYDPFGRRVEKKCRERLTRFVWDEYTLLHETDETGSSTTFGFEPGSFVPLFQIRDGKIQSILCDRIGTPRELIDAEGRITWSMRTDPWGNVVDSTPEAGPCPFRFQGQYFDPESGLHYNYFRYYDPEVSRFISPDPLGLDGGLSPYQYTPNPLEWIDPLGLCHRTPWAQMTKEEKNAFKHSYSRHGAELGLPNWKEKNAPALQKQFLAVTDHIKANGTVVPGPIYKPWNGNTVEVTFHEAEFNGVKYYYYEDKATGQFISAGKAR